MDAPSINRFAHASYRADRTIVEPSAVDDMATLTVFVGLYNSDPYFQHLIGQIESQKVAHVRWLFVDNASSDNTWQNISGWASASNRDVTLVRNGFNLGATGSIFVNFDLVTTEWATFIHQDDIYLPAHLETLSRATAKAPAGAVGVFSDLGRADPDGKAIGSFPPPIWMVPDLDPPTVFLALLRNHCIPWPALAVRTEVFRETEAPWHSTAFPDTEITMRLAGRGTFVHVSKETMRYRDSITSESRSIDDRERKFGATVSLFRVFGSDEFASLASALPVSERSAFVTGLESAIAVRLGETDRGRLVLAGALERLAELWDSTEPTSLERLSALYGGLGGTATSGLLGRMAAAAGGTAEVAPSEIPLDAAQDVVVSRTHQVATAVRRLYERIGHRIPYGLRRLVARTVIRLATRSDTLSPWRFEWR